MEFWPGYVSAELTFMTTANISEGYLTYGWRGQLKGMEMDFHSCMFLNHLPSYHFFACILT